MSTLKGLVIIVTMLAGGSSLAMAPSESTLGTPPVASGVSNPAALQHLAQRGGLKHSGSASNTEARQNKGHYKPGQ